MEHLLNKIIREIMYFYVTNKLKWQEISFELEHSWFQHSEIMYI